MADSKVVIDGVEYFKDHSGLLANAQTNPVVDLGEAAPVAPVEEPVAEAPVAEAPVEDLAPVADAPKE